MPFDHVRVPHMTLLNDGRICYVAYTSEKDLDREKMKDYHKRNYSLHILSPDKAQSNRRDIKTGDRCFNHTNMWADASGERIIFYGSQLPNGEDVDGHFLVTTSANGTEEIDVQWFSYDDAFTEELENIM